MVHLQRLGGVLARRTPGRGAPVLTARTLAALTCHPPPRISDAAGTGCHSCVPAWRHPSPGISGRSGAAEAAGRRSRRPQGQQVCTARRLSSESAASAAAGGGGEDVEEMEFQAETRQLLDIVTHSLYTDREVFLRELVSNASDALEKLRHARATGTLSGEGAGGPPLEIRVTTDEANNTLTVSDTGIGMTREELVSNLGTIARSGSKAFVQEMQMQAEAGAGGADSSGVIGRFGVGFYSGFMVADKVDVRSRSAGKADEDEGTQHEALVWESTGTGRYTISPLPEEVRQDRGTSVVLHLRPDLSEYSTETAVEAVLKKYSNFVGFPIYLNGNRVNTIDAIWLDDPKSVDQEKHSAFYKYVSSMYDDPLSTIHFRADAPLDIKALFYIPSFHQEKYGMGRMDPGVSLYSRKVLIETKSPDILPDWLRFVKGVVDSEDLPLSISREKPQDTALVAKMKRALTRKVISHLSNMMKKETDKYKEEFYKEYSFFLKEGICQDFENQSSLSKLLYFETNKGLDGELTSLEEYVSRCPPEQKDIYYLFAPSRELALQSPYMEAFGEDGREVIFIYTAIDDFVMANLKAFEGRDLVSADRSGVGASESAGKGSDENKDEGGAKKEEGKDGDDGSGLSTKEADEFCTWFKSTLDAKVSTCRTTSRLSSSPAVVTDAESGALRRMMRMVETSEGGTSSSGMPLPKQTVEINPRHEIVVGIDRIRERDPVLARVLAEQVFDNCLVAAGLLDDGRSMLPRLNDLMLCVVKSSQPGNAGDGGGDGSVGG